MAFFVVEPEVPGGLGERSQVDLGPDGHPVVTRLHFEFGPGSFGDDLLTSHPVFLVTAPLADALQDAGINGATFDPDVEVTVDDNIRVVEPDFVAPALVWLHFTGRPGVDDLALTADHRLVVSDTALDVMRRFQIDQADVAPYEGT